MGPVSARFRRALTAVASVAIVSAVAGCGLLFPFSADLPGEGFPSPRATYTSGSATIVLSGAEEGTITLDQISEGPHVYAEFGATISWFNDEGWALRYSGVPDAAVPFGTQGYVELDHVVDRAHLSALDGSRCIVTVDESSDSRLAGSATCRGLVWVDALREPPAFGFPGTAPEGDRFAAEISFEAED
jgi:hypothetical protein